MELRPSTGESKVIERSCHYSGMICYFEGKQRRKDSLWSTVTIRCILLVSDFELTFNFLRRQASHFEDFDQFTPLRAHGRVTYRQSVAEMWR